MAHIISAEVERWPVAGAFSISRGAKTYVDVVVVTVGDGRYEGRGEATPIYYHGETAEGCVDAIKTLNGRQVASLNRAMLQSLMPRGAARNAIDCALWDLESRRSGSPVWELAGLQCPQAIPTAFTISVDIPSVMEISAKKAFAQGFSLLKCKLTGSGDRERVAAVKQGAPGARLIVDANESWVDLNVADEAAALKNLGVELIEQPLPRGQEQILETIQSTLPFCADESCQDQFDLSKLNGFAAINIKLDKAGGLTEAIKLASIAHQHSKRLMIGCMLCTSLAIAPAFLLAQRAEWVDLDGALLLEKDRDGGLSLQDGHLFPCDIWGT